MQKVMGNGGSGKGGGSSNSEKWLDSGYKLKEPTVSYILKISSKERDKGRIQSLQLEHMEGCGCHPLKWCLASTKEEARSSVLEVLNLSHQLGIQMQMSSRSWNV